MFSRTAVLVLASLAAAGQQRESPPPAQATGSISGLVRDAGTRSPIKNARVLIDFSINLQRKQISTTTDAQGRYTLSGVPPGGYRVLAETPANRVLTGGVLRGTAAFQGSRSVTVHPGLHLKSVDIDIRTDSGPGTISGRVLDENMDPVPGAWVRLVIRRYEYGVLRYGVSGITTTNDLGEYVLSPPTGGYAYSYLLEARSKVMQLDAASSAAPNPKQRKRVFAPTFFPNSPSISGASPVLPRSGEHLEGMDIRIVKTPSYCIEATLAAEGAPGPLNFELSSEQPVNGMGSFISQPGGKAGPDGRIRVCDLSPGRYLLAAFFGSPSTQGPPSMYGATVVGITDADVRGLNLSAATGKALTGRVLLDGVSPERRPESQLRIQLSSMSGDRGSACQSSIPGQFSCPGLFLGDYGVKVSGVPQGLYVKDITYGGLSVLNGVLRHGTGLGNAELTVVVAGGGASLSAKVVDKDGEPVPDAYVYVIPADVASEAALSAALVSGRSDQNGSYSSATLPPGKYDALASRTEVVPTPEGIEKLWRTRHSGAESDIAAGAAVQVTLQPVPLD